MFVIMLILFLYEPPKKELKLKQRTNIQKLIIIPPFMDLTVGLHLCFLFFVQHRVSYLRF